MIFSNSDEMQVATVEGRGMATSGPKVRPFPALGGAGFGGLVVMWILDEEPTVGRSGEPNCVVIPVVIRFNRRSR
jgi:hypothetical protein